MRNAFAQEITRLAGIDPRLVVLSGDIGNRLFDRYKESHPKRFYNCGIAEANMISLAAGLASGGFRPVCYTIAPFITARCFEQIRLDVCYHQMPVVIVGTGAGLSYASLGATHHSLDDVALLRSLPEMRVVAPADAQELRSCLRTALQQDHPVYIRIGKKGEPQVFKEPPIFEFGNWSLVRPASGNTAILATGVMLAVALETALELAKEGIDARVYSSSSIKPLDEDVLDREFGDCSVVSTIEEHGLTGGFGSAVAEWMADRWPRPGARLLRFGCRDEFLHYAGNQDEARESCGLTVAHISTSLRSALSTGVAAPSLTLLHN